MRNFRNYVKDAVDKELLRLEVELPTSEVDAITDSTIFEWNEIGDPDANFEQLVSWNVDQYLSHTSHV